MPNMMSLTMALLAKHWKLSWRSLLIHQFSVLAIASLVIVIMADDREIDGDSLASHFVVLTSLIFLLAPILSSPSKTAGTLGAGFPYTQEFALPIPTTLLALVPLLFFAVFMLVAYLVPISVLSMVFDVTGPQATYAVMILESTLVILCLSWWTNSNFGHAMGWVVVILLYWNQFLYPEFIYSEETARIGVSSASVYIQSAIVTLALVLIMIAGIKKQRFGENLFGLSQDSLFQWQSLSVRGSSFFGSRECPTHSAIAAENWRERQSSGPGQAVPLGIVFGLVSLITISLVRQNGGFEDGTALEEVLALSGAFYFVVVLFLQMRVFGISYRNGKVFNTAFDRCRPMGTARLFFIKLTNNIFGLASAALAMVIVVWLFGPLFIGDFSSIRADALQRVQDTLSIPFLELARNTLLFLIMGGTLIYFFAALNAWFMLKPKLMGWVIAGLGIYVFLAVATLVLITEDSEFTALSEQWLDMHLWILILGLPAALLFFCRSLLNEHVLSQRQLTGMSACALVIAMVYIFDLSVLGFYENPELSLEQLVWYSMMGLTPLLAIVVGLWTMGEIRHA